MQRRPKSASERSSKSSSNRQGSSVSALEAKFAQAIELGVVVRAHGVRGALKVHVYHADATTLGAAAAADLALRATSGRLWPGVSVVGRSLAAVQQTGAVLVEVETIRNRDQAEACQGATLLVRREVVALEPNEYLYADLTGCQARDSGGVDLGQVREVFSAGASAILVIRQGETERLIPFMSPWVVEVDVARRQLTLAEIGDWESYPAESSVTARSTRGAG